MCPVKCPPLPCDVHCKYGHVLDSVGCPTCECIDPCKDVKCKPYQKCVVKVVQCFVAPCPSIAECVGKYNRTSFISAKLGDDPKGPCHEALLALPEPIPIGAYVPQCQDDGYYRPQQCSASTGHCWCVTRDGTKMDGTETGPGEPRHNCTGDNQWSRKVTGTTLSLPNNCNQPKDSGPCDGHIERYYYNAQSRMCFTFIYGGCGGNGNNFKTREECEDTCPVCGPVCAINCEFGNKMDANGCATCDCIDPCKVS
ncbi:Kunitz-type serine protease inhibitor textilinin-4, partial [Lamellibrachia satsuma]